MRSRSSSGISPFKLASATSKCGRAKGTIRRSRVPQLPLLLRPALPDKIDTMPSIPARVLSTREGRYAILEADLGDGPEPAGIPLEDPETDRLHIRLRRDWEASAPEDDVLPYIEED